MPTAQLPTPSSGPFRLPAAELGDFVARSGRLGASPGDSFPHDLASPRADAGRADAHELLGGRP